MMILSERRHLAEKICGEIKWQTEVMGFIRCPGESLHTGRTDQKHCRVTLDGAPTVFCFHQHCMAIIEAINKELRRAIAAAESGGKANIKPRELSPEELERKAKMEAAARLSVRASASLQSILKRWSWNPQDACAESPITSEGVEQDWRLLFSMFESDDLIWAGTKYDTGKPEHARHFRTFAEWRKCKTAPGQLTCPSVFKPGTFSRSNEAVAMRRFLVVESDTLLKEEICAVFKWSQQFMRLRAIVDSGGKSLHGWFDFPHENILTELKVILPALGCDPSLFRPSQPCRLPGARRGDKWQSLIYFNGGSR